MKKNNSLLFACTLLVLSLASCTNTPIETNEETINVKLCLGGYGCEWLDTAIEKFENVYEDEGYKINLIRPSELNEGNAVINELSTGYEKNKIDLYFTRSIMPKKVVDGDYGCLVEDITDSVYNQKAIDFSGKEENLKVIEKLDNSFGDEWYKYNDRAYNFFYQKSVGALVVNKTKLAKVGIDEVPVTTDEFLNCIHVIKEKNVNREIKFSPMTFVGSGVNGYPAVMMNAWFAQYSGLEKWDEFWSMNNADGSYNLEKGYEVYLDDGLHNAAELAYTVFDQKNFVAGSSNNGLSSAHADILNDNNGAVFMFDGDWMLNECLTDFGDKVSNLAFINVPVISSLGEKLWGETYSKEQCENILSKVIRLSDEGKDVASIVNAVKNDLSLDVSEDSVLEVCNARGIYNNRGVETANAYIAKGVGEKHLEIASLFLRMIASDDFGQMYANTAHCASPYYSNASNTSYELHFQNNHSAIVNHKYGHGIWPIATGLRAKVGYLGEMFPICGTQIHSYAFRSSISEYSDDGTIDPEKKGNYRIASEERLTAEYQTITNNWSNWISNIQ